MVKKNLGFSLGLGKKNYLHILLPSAGQEESDPDKLPGEDWNIPTDNN